MTALFIVTLLVLPALIIVLVKYQRWADRVGVILLCYLLGLLMGGSGLLPASVSGAQQGLLSISIALAIPMLLFNMDLKHWRSKAGKAALSMFFAIVAAVCTATTLFFIFRQGHEARAADMAALVTGVYTGGTPNLAAVKAALDISHSLFIVVHSIDTLATGVYLLVLLACVPLFRLWLGEPERNLADSDNQNGAVDSAIADSENYAPLLQPSNFLAVISPLALSLAVGLASFGAATFLGRLIGVQDTGAMFIVFLTTISLLLSLSHRVRALRFSYAIGMYCIYVFCVAVAAMVSISDFKDIEAVTLLFVFGAVFGTMLLHMLFCKLGGIDADTFMVTSVAAICSPPFVPIIAKALNNSQAILSGMAAGILGYVLGSYLGIALGLLLRSML